MKTEALPEREFFASSAGSPEEARKPIKLEAMPAMTALEVASHFKKKDVAEYLRSVK